MSGGRGSSSSYSNNNNINNSNSNDGSDERLLFLRGVGERNEIGVPSKFKSAHYKKPARRHKSARQLVSDENKRINALLSKANKAVEGSGTAKRLVSQGNPTSAWKPPPSIRPAKKYCDVTGLKGLYKSPTNNIRYHNAEVYQLIVKPMAPGVDQEYLKLRGANFVLK
ncbi:Ies6p [Saccharomyces cerevisiae x Saccharomyces kudriavzevii VIN7]|uniref:Ies6p n=1 Tax=Saccharomyces cerevisiae x Saccharomyces kudriavzevii (strain VIN7) TaxID=1095631 RepID=H0GTM4_SACCK|nr:Ies6p [Saccharomyces cerevisiae x Saccharomyces kudriavzevii VIN7]